MPFEDRKQMVAEPEHLVCVDKRNNMTVTGVDDVESFSEEMVVLLTNMGKLTVKGHELHINRLNVENGELTMTGKVDFMEYTEEKRQDGGFFARLFR